MRDAGGSSMALIRPILVTLTTDERLALRRLANDRGVDLEEAAAVALRDWLMANGYLELEHELYEDTEASGEA
jgi:hypothetical protein